MERNARRSHDPRVLWLGVVLGLAVSTGPSRAQPVEPALSDADLVLFEVRLGPHQVTDALPGYQRGSELLLPLGELAKLLTVAIRADPAAGTASGFVLQERRDFHLDADQALVVLDGRKRSVPKDLLQRAEDDIYVAVSLLSEWLPVDLEVDLAALVLHVKPREPLPLQLRLEREQQAAGLRATPPPSETYARSDSPYRMFDVPFIDATLAADFRRTPAAARADAQYTMFLTGDLLRMEAAVYAGRAAGQDDQVRVTLGRTDPDARLLGPLHARSFAMGSVVMPGVANVARTSTVGDGVLLGNRPLARPTTFDRHSLQGDLPPGWDVELYFNDALVGFQQGNADNRYEFNDLPLLYGSNEFRLVFHGPQGQLRVERASFLLEDTLIPAGSFHYQFGWQRDAFDQPRLLGQLDYGFTRHLSATAGVYGLTGPDEVDQRYGFGGLRLSLGPLLLNGDRVQLEQGGSLSELGLKTRVGGMTLGIGHDRLSNFVSDFFPATADPVQTRDVLRIDGGLALPVLPRLPVTVALLRDRLESGLENREASGRLSSYVAGTSLTGQYRWRSIGDARTADAAFQISRRVAGTGLRGQLNYLLRPEEEPSSITLAADRNFGLDYQANVGVSRGFVESTTLYTAGVNKVLGEYALGVSASYSTQDEITLGARLFMALARDPGRGAWFRNAQPMADSGALSAQVFVDSNLNGVPDAGELPVPGAEFLINGARSQIRSDANGLAYLGRLTPRQFANIAIDPASLEDPQWATRPAGLRLLPRPGRVAAKKFPVITTSEIDGTIYVIERGLRRGVGGVEFQLQDREGTVVKTATSAADGFYVVPAVLPGDYLLVSPDHIRRFLRDDTGIRLIRVPADGQLVSGVDFILGRRGAAAAPMEPGRRDAAAPLVESPAAPRYYTVQKGEWLWMLAERFYGKATISAVNAMIQANPGVIPSTGEVHEGLRIIVPTLAQSGNR